MGEYEEILRQHHEVMTHVERLDYLTGTEARALTHSTVLAQLRAHLTALRECLAPHFAGEESGGYFAQARTARPGLGRKIDSLAAEHGELLGLVDLAVTHAVDAEVEAIQTEVAAFLHRLREHETAERNLLQDAALVDIGASD